MPIIVKQNRFQEVKGKMVAGGKLNEKIALEEIAKEVERTGPYKGDLETKVNDREHKVEVDPWWIGFIEIGSVTHASRPFLAPAANKVFAQFTP